MENKEYAVEFKDVSKVYKIKNRKDKSVEENFYALKDVSFKVEKGEVVGILGTNGSGKSTVSNILAGITLPDIGEAIINGEQALIAIKSGLNNELTGIENIEFKGALLGFEKSKIEEIKNEIIEFSELGDFINQPVKSYSSGMKSRLGFSISINIDAEIIIIDEALSVGDVAFNEKCFNKIKELQEKGKTIFFVSHSLSEIKKYCTKGLWIEGGVFKGYDDVDVISREYYMFIKEYKQKSDKEKKAYKYSVYKNRLNGKKVTVKKSGIPYVAIIMAIMFASVFSVGFIGGIKADIRPTQLEKDYNYVFIRQGEDIDKLKSKERTYLQDKEGNIITDIVYVSFDKNGNKVEVSKLPTNLQYYYKNKKTTDEVKMIKYMDESKKNFMAYFKDVLGVNLDDIYFINNKKLNNSLKMINTSKYIKKDVIYWNINHEKISVDRKKLDNKSVERVNKLMLKEIAELSDGKLKLYIKNVTNSKDYKQLLEIVQIIRANSKLSTLTFKYKEISTNSISIRELLEKENTKMAEIEITDEKLNKLLDKKLTYYKNYKYLYNNIYVKEANREIAKILNDKSNLIENIDKQIDINNNEEDEIIQEPVTPEVMPPVTPEVMPPVKPEVTPTPPVKPEVTPPPPPIPPTPPEEIPPPDGSGDQDQNQDGGGDEEVTPPFIAPPEDENSTITDEV